MVVSSKTLRDEQLLSSFGAFTNYSAMLLSRYFGITGKALSMVLEGASASMTQIGLHMEYQNNQISLGQYKGESAANAVQAVLTIGGFGGEMYLEKKGARIAYLHELYSIDKRPEIYSRDDSRKLLPMQYGKHQEGMEATTSLFQRIVGSNKLFGSAVYSPTSSSSLTVEMTSMQYFHFGELKDNTGAKSFAQQEEQKLQAALETSKSGREQAKSVEDYMEKTYFGRIDDNHTKESVQMRERNEQKYGSFNDPNNREAYFKDLYLHYGKEYLATQRTVQKYLVGLNTLAQTSQFTSNEIIMNKPSFY